MSYHVWGDEWFEQYGADLNEAMDYIMLYVNNTSYCYLSCKEKYGTIRYEMVVPQWDYRLRRIQLKLPFFKKKTRWGDLPIYLFEWDECWLRRKWVTYGWKKTLEAAQSAIAKWPHLEDELMADLASNEDLVGKEVHDKYWKTFGE